MTVCRSVRPYICPSVTKWFLYNNIFFTWHTMMIRHTYNDFDLRRTSVDFRSNCQRSNLDLKLFNFSAPQLHFPLAYNNDTSQIYWPWPERDLIFYKYSTSGAEIHVGLFFNVKICPLAIPMKFIYCNYTWSKVKVGSFFNFKIWTQPTKWRLYFITTRRAEIYVGSFFNVKIWPLRHPN